MKNLIGKTIRLTVKLNTLQQGTVTYEDFKEMPKIGDFLNNVQFEEHGSKLGRDGKLEKILKVEEYLYAEWREVLNND